jgi:SAM-dependent methyltransferase
MPAAESRGAADGGYRAYHAPRFRFLLELARSVLPGGARRVLDIGPSPFTALLRQTLPCPVDTLGLEPDAPHSGDRGSHHLADLNHPESLPSDLPFYDLIVFAEVLEHLHTSPAIVLEALRRLLAPEGVLILQTPNAASLPKRLKLLAGRNPYELIREERSNPGHFREYTLRELLDFAARTNFTVTAKFRRFYFDARHAHHGEGDVRVQPFLGSLKNAAYRALPPFLREGLTVVLRPDAARRGPD